MLDRERLVQIVFEEHNTKLLKDDPILLTLAVHEEVFRQYSEHIEARMGTLKDEIANITKGQLASMNAAGRQIVSKAEAEANERLKETLQGIAAEIAEDREDAEAAKTWAFYFMLTSAIIILGGLVAQLLFFTG